MDVLLIHGLLKLYLSIICSGSIEGLGFGQAGAKLLFGGCAKTRPAALDHPAASDNRRKLAGIESRSGTLSCAGKRVYLGIVRCIDDGLLRKRRPSNPFFARWTDARFATRISARRALPKPPRCRRARSAARAAFIHLRWTGSWLSGASGGGASTGLALFAARDLLSARARAPVRPRPRSAERRSELVMRPISLVRCQG